MNFRLRLVGPERSLSLRAQQVVALWERVSLARCCQQERVRLRLHGVTNLLRVLGPMATLERGYSITLDERGQPLRSASDCIDGQKLITRWHDGEVRSTIEK